MIRLLTATFVSLMSFAPAVAGLEDYEREPINYSDTDASDPLAKMKSDYESGTLSFGEEIDLGFLRRFLNHLKVPIESQVLVYSRTSFQNDRIRPETPRAIYFSEDYYIGWVQGGEIELISLDPVLGPVFYRMTASRAPFNHPRLFRDRTCLNCHGGAHSHGVPGMTIRSVRADARGFPILSAGTFRTDHASPLSERWGGWYVTGSHAGDRHMGNLIFEEVKSGGAKEHRDLGEGRKSLDEVIDTSKYLVGTSDIVALMVLEHQITVHNAITRAHLNTRRWLHQNSILAEHFGESPDQLSASTKQLLSKEVERLLSVMLFADERQLEGWGVEGSEAFQTAFLEGGRKTPAGRSLREFDLMSRLFKNRLSYMIHSNAFEAIPPVFKNLFYKKLWSTLETGSKPGAHLSAGERKRIISLLKEIGKIPAPEVQGEPEKAG